MDPAIREARRPVQLWRTLFAYLYQNSRLQFHPAIYVLTCALILSFLLTIMTWALNFLFEPPNYVNYELLGAFTVCLTVAEFARGHVLHWLDIPAGETSFKAMAAGGAALGLTLWIVTSLKWLDPRWFELPLMIGGGTIVYLVLGFLFTVEERKTLRERHDT